MLSSKRRRKILPDSGRGQAKANELMSSGWKGLNISFITKLRGFDKQRQNDSLAMVPGSLHLWGLSSLRFSEHATIIRGAKKHQALEQGYWSPRSWLESGIHCWVSKLLLDSEGQRAFVVSVSAWTRKTTWCLLPRRLELVLKKNLQRASCPIITTTAQTTRFLTTQGWLPHSNRRQNVPAAKRPSKAPRGGIKTLQVKSITIFLVSVITSKTHC